MAAGGRAEDLKYRTPLYPLVPILAIVCNLIVIVSLAFIPEQRISLYCGVPFLIACYLYYHFAGKKRMAEVGQADEKKAV